MGFENLKDLISTILNKFGVGISKTQLTDILSVGNKIDKSQIQWFIDELNDDDETRGYIVALGRDDYSSELHELIQQAYEWWWTDTSNDEWFKLCSDLLLDRVRDRRRSYFAPYLQWADDQVKQLFESLKINSKPDPKWSMGDYINNISRIGKVLSSDEYKSGWDSAMSLDKYVDTSVYKKESLWSVDRKAVRKHIRSIDEGKMRSIANHISKELQSITEDITITKHHIVMYNILQIFLYREEFLGNHRNSLINLETRKEEAINIPKELVESMSW